MFERWPRRILGALAAGLALAGGARGEEVSRNVRALSQAYNESGQELFGKLAAKPGNMVISPYSIGAVMAMAVEGASGANAEEMIRVLKHRLPQREIGEANKEALEIFRSLDRSAVAVSCPQGMQLSGRDARQVPRRMGAALLWHGATASSAKPNPRARPRPSSAWQIR